MEPLDPPVGENDADQAALRNARRWWSLMAVVATVIVVALAGWVLRSRASGSEPPGQAGLPVATTPAPADLGPFTPDELVEFGVNPRRVAEFEVVGDGRFVFFAIPAGANIGARVRLYDRGAATVSTVQRDLDGVGPLLPVNDERGIVYLTVGAGKRAVMYADVAGTSRVLLEVAADESVLDYIIVAPSDVRLVIRELRGGDQVLWSLGIETDRVALVEAQPGASVGEGVEDPIVIEGDVVRFYGDPDGTGDFGWFVVPITGGEVRSAAP